MMLRVGIFVGLICAIAGYIYLLTHYRLTAGFTLLIAIGGTFAFVIWEWAGSITKRIRK